MMARTCRHDMELLMLVHRELSPLQALVTKFHIARCRTCQARLTELTSVSRLVSTALRRPGSSAAIPIPPTFQPKKLTLVLALAVMATLALAVTSAVMVFHPFAKRPAPNMLAPAIPNQTCAPNAPPAVRKPKMEQSSS